MAKLRMKLNTRMRNSDTSSQVAENNDTRYLRRYLHLGRGVTAATAGPRLLGSRAPTRLVMGASGSLIPLMIRLSFAWDNTILSCVHGARSHWSSTHEHMTAQEGAQSLHCKWPGQKAKAPSAPPTQ
eukprot:COSAG03_NODE_674_length_6361_cov_5.994251_3_plen_127_part_00